MSVCTFPTNNNTSASVKIFDALILTVCFAFNTLVLGVDWQAVAVALGGSFSGAVILAYFRRDSRKLEQGFKVLCSSIGGLVLGTVLQEYFQILNPKYQLGLFFVCSLLSLVLLRALISVTEKNAADICKGVMFRILNLPNDGKPISRRSVGGRSHKRRHESEGEKFE